MGDRPVDWRLLLYDMVEKLVGNVGKEKLTMVCPYIFYLYKEQHVLSPELMAYNLKMEMIKYNCTLDRKSTQAASKSE